MNRPYNGRETDMEILAVALAVADFGFIIALLFLIGREKKNRGFDMERHSDFLARLSRVQVELERRLHCVEEDLEKIPVEEVNAERERLERFNDGISNILSYGPEVPKLNKEAARRG